MFDIGAEIKQLRESRGLTQEQLADIWGTSQDRICKIERNRLRIKADEYLELKELLSSVETVRTFTIEWPGKQMVKC